MIKFKPLLLASLAALVVSSQSVYAQNPYGYGQNGQQYQAPYGNPYQNYYGYNRNNNNGPFNNSFFRNGPFGNNSFRNGPFGNNSFRNGPFGGNNMPFTGNSSFGERFWPGRGSYYDDVLPANGPWNRSWGRAPWNRDYDNLWGRNGGPSKWFDPSDPREGMAEAWEDMMITPNRLGTMPGGWKAPSISVPNPIDVGDEFKNVAKDMPSEMQNFSEGFTYGDEEGYNNDPNRGSMGFSPQRKKDDGVNFNAKSRR